MTRARRPRRSGVPGSPTMADVARVAEVSMMSVSRVVNERSGVNDQTRQRILEAMATLGFTPHRAAQELASGAPSTVTVVTSDAKLNGYAAVVSGVARAAQQAGFTTQVTLLPRDGSDVLATVANAAVNDAGIAVFVVFDDLALEAFRTIKNLGNLVVLARSADVIHPSTEQIPLERYLWVDEYAGARSATEYLLDLGHETVHHLAIPSWLVNERENAWRDALAERGLHGELVSAPGWSAADGYVAMEGLLQTQPRPSAVFCGNDSIALGALKRLQDAGLKVPQDVAVVGFDDAPDSAYFAPSLTTVQVDWAELGSAAFQRGHDLLASAPVLEADSPSATPELIVRASS